MQSVTFHAIRKVSDGYYFAGQFSVGTEWSSRPNHANIYVGAKAAKAVVRKLVEEEDFEYSELVVVEVGTGTM